MLLTVDLSVRRVLEALQAGPATPGILATSFDMGVDESHEALAAAVDEGLAEQVGPIAYGLTETGRRLAALTLSSDRWREGVQTMAQLEHRNQALARLDP